MSLCCSSQSNAGSLYTFVFLQIRHVCLFFYQSSPPVDSPDMGYLSFDCGDVPKCSIRRRRSFVMQRYVCVSSVMPSHWSNFDVLRFFYRHIVRSFHFPLIVSLLNPESIHRIAYGPP